eukprot:3216793-Rhodomonas_salina.1
MEVYSFQVSKRFLQVMKVLRRTIDGLNEESAHLPQTIQFIGPNLTERAGRRRPPRQDAFEIILQWASTDQPNERYRCVLFSRLSSDCWPPSMSQFCEQIERFLGCRKENGIMYGTREQQHEQQQQRTPAMKDQDTQTETDQDTQTKTQRLAAEVVQRAMRCFRARRAVDKIKTLQKRQAHAIIDEDTQTQTRRLAAEVVQR